MCLSEAELSVASSSSSPCVAALRNFGHDGPGNDPAGGAGDERGVSAPAGRRRGAAAVCELRPGAGEALRPGAGGGQQGEVAAGRLLSPGAAEPLAAGETVRSHQGLLSFSAQTQPGHHGVTRLQFFKPAFKSVNSAVFVALTANCDILSVFIFSENLFL